MNVSLWTDFHEIFRTVRIWHTEQLMKLWVSGSSPASSICLARQFHAWLDCVTPLRKSAVVEVGALGVFLVKDESTYLSEWIALTLNRMHPPNIINFLIKKSVHHKFGNVEVQLVCPTWYTHGGFIRLYHPFYGSMRYVYFQNCYNATGAS